MLVLRVANGLGAAGEGEVARRRGTLQALFIMFYLVSQRALTGASLQRARLGRIPRKCWKFLANSPPIKENKALRFSSAPNSQPLRLDTGRKPRQDLIA